MIRSSLIVLLMVATLASSDVSAATAKSKFICVNAAGTFAVRGKCKKSESKVAVKTFFPTTVQGPQGPQGVVGPQGPAGNVGAQGVAGVRGLGGSFDLAACRKISVLQTSFPFPVQDDITATAVCSGAGEYMLTYGYNTNANFGLYARDPNLRAIVSANTKLGGTFRQGVELSVTRYLTTSFFTVTIDAVCCPRN